MDIFILHLINGITLGAMYALVATGLSVVFGVLRMVNFAHGDLFMLSGYLLVFLYVEKGVPYGLAVVFTVAGMVLVGFLFERIVIRPVVHRTWRIQLIATLAASIVLTNLAILIWGTTPRQAPTILSQNVFRVASVNISYQRILLLVVAVVSFLLLTWFVQKTRTGKAMRAISQNREASVVYGLDIHGISSITFGIGSGFAALAASIITPLYSVEPTVGAMVMMKALAAVILGGLGHVRGTIYAAVLLGITEALFAGYVSYPFRDAAAFIVLIFVLLLRPQGIFGRKVSI
ncbi:MAG: branched-chain amino acid ABC transporter permease [Anaerolineales bacterium]|nr:branched-chain amino acid ABC transporter permease [Anaerolineales bacterium]